MKPDEQIRGGRSLARVDVLLKLRVLIWLLVLGLWGLVVYQYVGEDEASEPAMQALVNPYQPPIAAAPEPVAAAAPSAMANPAVNVVPAPDAVGPALLAPPRAAVPPRLIAPPARRFHRVFAREDRSIRPDPPVPPGFFKTITPHFSVYAEAFPAPRRFLGLLEALHSNLMLDLEPFAPWTRRQRVVVFLFKTQESYHRVTGRPAWSGGASSVANHKVYVFESDELTGILAHELTHTYFDSFFLGGTMDPLWLSEGMATLVQVERGLAAPDWLREKLVVLGDGGGFGIEELTSATTTAGWPDDKVRLWYAQSYSLVRYLIRSHTRAPFFKFAAYLRRSVPAERALALAYGPPYTSLRALEIAWRASIARPRRTRGPRPD